MLGMQLPMAFSASVDRKVSSAIARVAWRSVPRTALQNIYRPTVARVLAVIAVTYTAYYLWWRVTSTVNTDAIFLSALLIIAEMFGFGAFVLFAFMTWDVTRKPTSDTQKSPPNATV